MPMPMQGCRAFPGTVMALSFEGGPFFLGNDYEQGVTKLDLIAKTSSKGLGSSKHSHFLISDDNILYFKSFIFITVIMAKQTN